MPNRTCISQNPVGPYTLKGAPKLVEQIAQALENRKQQHPHETPSDWGLVTSAGIREEIEKLFPGINARHYGNQTGSNEMESVRFLMSPAISSPTLTASLKKLKPSGVILPG